MGIFDDIKIAGVGLVLAGAVAFTVHYKSVVSERDNLLQNNRMLQQAFEAQKKATTDMKTLLDLSYEKFDKLADVMSDMAQNQQDARKELEVLNGKFREHDLEELAIKKPALIESRVNSGTRDTLRMLEQSTDIRADEGSSE